MAKKTQNLKCKAVLILTYRASKKKEKKKLLPIEKADTVNNLPVKKTDIVNN